MSDDLFSTDTSISDSVTEDAVDAAMFDESTPQDVEASPASPAPSEPASSDEPAVVAPEVTEDGDKPEKAETPPVEESQEPPPAPITDAELLNWDSAPKNFREKFDEYKKENLELRQNSLQEKFLTDSDEFLKELSELSTHQYQTTTQQIVKSAIDALPNEFAEYMAQVAPDAIAKSLSDLSPDLLAEQLFGKGTTAAMAKRIMTQVKDQDLVEYLNDNDSNSAPEPDVRQAKQKEPEAKSMTPEEIESLVQQRIADAGRPQKVEKLRQDTYGEIMKPVEALIAEAGLAPTDSDTPQEREYKAWVTETIGKDVFEYLVDNEKNSARAKQMDVFMESLDEAAVKRLASTAKILAEEFAGKRIEMLTMQRAKAKGTGTEAKKTPPKAVPSAGSIPTFGNPQGAPFGRVSDLSEADFERAGM